MGCNSIRHLLYHVPMSKMHFPLGWISRIVNSSKTTLRSNILHRDICRDATDDSMHRIHLMSSINEGGGALSWAVRLHFRVTHCIHCLFLKPAPMCSRWADLLKKSTILREIDTWAFTDYCTQRQMGLIRPSCVSIACWCRQKCRG